jgi:DNA-binding LacI/PurR family transcriptional regulator
MPTIKDVAREAGVSIATVSYVLNKKDQNIPPHTRQQVLNAVKRVGYSPNINGRNLKSSQSRLIGYAWHLLPPDQVNPVLDRFAYYLAQEAEALGYHLLTFTYPREDPLPVYQELIQTGRVDAFVIASTEVNDPRIRFLLDREFPFVSFGRANPNWRFPCVDTDGRAGVREAVEYLISLGHRRIGMIAWPEDSISGSYRVEGYLEALHAHGLNTSEDLLLRGENNETAGRNAVAHWSSLPIDQQPTAVIAVSDLVAVGVMHGAEEFGFVPGKTLSVIGFDDMYMSQYLRPALTTLHQPIREISAEIMTMLELLLSKDAPSEPSMRLITPRLVIRETASPPPG